MQHSILSASASHRWLNCTASVNLTKDLPDTSSPYAEEGTLAHAAAEHFLKKVLGRATEDLDPKTDVDMINYAKDYAEYVMQQNLEGFVLIEQKVDYGKYTKGYGFGTADCIVINPNGIMHIIDFKYGKGVEVDATYNTQLMLYALGALEVNVFTKIISVVLHIYQPRINNICTYSISLDDLLAFGNGVKAKAEEALGDKGVFKVGSWCRFCKVKALCKARAEHMLSIEPVDANLLSNEEIGQALTKSMDLVEWRKDLEDVAFNKLLDGEKIAGYKIVEGRSNRTWENQDGAFKEIIKLNEAYKDMLWEKKPISLTAVEKLLGKKEFAEIVGGYVIKPQGKPTMVEESDKRPEFKPDLEKIFN